MDKRAYLRSFSGLTSLHSVNIQPNSKLHPHPPKFSASAPGWCGFRESLSGLRHRVALWPHLLAFAADS